MESSIHQWFCQIRDAAARISDRVMRTPVRHQLALDDALGAQVWLKCENLQHTGAFKFRGACNALLQLTPAQREAGVFTVSSGNHGAALAAAGQQLGISVRVGVASNASPVKRANMEQYDAELITIEPGMTAREQFVEQQQASGRHFVPPYNHPHIICGQGTAALELLEQQPDLEILLTPLGGGGLLSGTAIVGRELGISNIYGVEPELAADGRASLEAGSIQPAMPPRSVCDGLLTSLGEETFAIIRRAVDDVLVVTDEQALAAQQLCFEHTGMWIEPSSATPLAAIKAYPQLFAAKRIGVVISGGNVNQLANS
ncbi:threonine dehydratase [Pseudidiomarina salinarum]|uniref:Threonine dehydratase n=1 Tax=Pseudidiomarina salinarum TaxID=435908 RepID=A0A094ITX1_9GAMM|nr:pyridoxal-phosphate dependent enzyme [Pseudidiomarina salinarum]KFZ31125.1 threonine dehydratase [Pseudidiomarina salinarum]RUO71210.1 serine/threonine dehydratase [Pseudidiomarina salinarum]